MESEELLHAMLYLSLTVVGVPGNIAVILAFLLVLHQESRLLPADAIMLHLACINLLVVGVGCLSETLVSFRLANVLLFGDAGCMSIGFVYSTSRSLSIWLTFVLSAYQCLSIAPPGSRWASVRALVPRYLGLVFLSLWILNTCMDGSTVFLFAQGSHNDSSHNDSSLGSHVIKAGFCYFRFPSKLSMQASGAALVVRDTVPMILMILASFIILVFLCRHSQQAKGHRSSGGSGGAEQQATKTVVVLVTLYVVLYGVDNGLWLYTLSVRKNMLSSLISDLGMFFSSLYAALSPMLIIVSNRKVNGRLRCVVW